MLSLFSGIGGFDLAAERAGIEVVAQSEVDPAASTLLSRRFPSARNLGDITAVSEEELDGLGPIDLVTAGWPCQGNSVAGRRGGMDDPRSGLWAEVVRVCARLRPRWVVGENVPGLLSVNGGRDFATVLGDLDRLGYVGAWRVLDARYFGVAQRRCRVFLVGHLGDGASPAAVLLEPEGRPWHPATSREAREGVAGTLGGGTGERGWAADVERMTFVPEVTPCLPAFGGPRGTTVNPQFGDHALAVVRALTGQGNRQDDQAAGQLVVAPALTGNVYADRKGEEAAVVIAAPLTAGSHPGSHQPGRHAEDDVNLVVSETLSSNPRNRSSSPGPVVVTGLEVGVHANQRGEARVSALAGSLNGNMSGKQYEGVLTGLGVRRLAPRECERLQGFPDGWTEDFADSTRYRMLGNAVAVPVAEWVLRRVGAEALDTKGPTGG